MDVGSAMMDEFLILGDEISENLRMSGYAVI